MFLVTCKTKYVVPLFQSTRQILLDRKRLILEPRRSTWGVCFGSNSTVVVKAPFKSASTRELRCAGSVIDLLSLTHVFSKSNLALQSWRILREISYPLPRKHASFLFFVWFRVYTAGASTYRQIDLLCLFVVVVLHSSNIYRHTRVGIDLWPYIFMGTV